MIGYPRWLASLLHRLFGLHFVEMQYGYRDYVLRVKRAPAGYLYVRICGDTKVLQKDGSIQGHYARARGFTFNFEASP